MSSPIPRDSVTARPTLRERSPVFAWVGRIDDAIYAGERIVVTAALLVMSGVVCLNILYQFLVNQRAVLQLTRAGESSPQELWPALVVGLAVLATIHASFANAPACRRNPPVVWLLTVLAFGATLVVCAGMLTLSSSVVTAVLALASGLMVLVAELDRPRSLDGAPFPIGARVAVAAIVIGTAAAVWMLLVFVPEGYTWAQKLALFLLLWMAFVGASMATHDHRHLTIDAVRKAVPASILPYFNFVSHLVAAVFTAAFMYLAFLYFSDRLVEDAAPGEIPDWLKVLSIPVSLAFVTVRFVIRGVESLLSGLLGLELAENVDDHGAFAAAAELEAR